MYQASARTGNFPAQQLEGVVLQEVIEKTVIGLGNRVVLVAHVRQTPVGAEVEDMAKAGQLTRRSRGSRRHWKCLDSRNAVSNELDSFL